MTGTASPSWKPRAEARKASTEASIATGSQGEISSSSGPPTLVRAFRATSETPNSVPAAAPRMRAVMVRGGAELRRGDQQDADREHPGQEGDQGGDGERGVAPPVCGSVTDEQRQAGGGHDHADPLPARRRWQPKSRSPITASITTPVESATWTMLSGASAIAATCRIQAAAPTPCRSRTTSNGTGPALCAAASCSSTGGASARRGACTGSRAA